MKNTQGGVLPLAKLQALKVTILHERFSRFLICTSGTKSRKASHMTFGFSFRFPGQPALRAVFPSLCLVHEFIIKQQK